ncbi:hypothetical protein cyc_07633 [Cyclospora cayetanensis]|uniref:C2H2-type domain-containing protein n=1 Tax=Cyclospora cayetanensis TaxID=88456 RepID=A0A1D3D358_9EIME|nr:hypothetical protein cyc_07633 [Cyclospora cayetanensis]
MGPLSCRICGCDLLDRNAFNEHHRDPWHLYNMRRRNQQLPCVSRSEFERKIELLRLARQYVRGDGPQGNPQQGEPDTRESPVTRSAAAFEDAVRCNRKGTDHRKKQHSHQEDGEKTFTATTDERSAAAKAAAAAWRTALQHYPERCNLFEQMLPFTSTAANLEYMKEAYGFFIPDEDYCTNYAGLLRCLWRRQQQQPSCLYCCKRFRGIRAALQHMQQQRHFQLKWDEEQQELLQGFYDYRKSYYELLERLPGQESYQLPAPEEFSEVETNQGVTSEHSEVNEEDWEYCSSEDESAALEQQKLESLLQTRGWRRARVTDEGHLQLPNGQEMCLFRVLHRSHAVFCRQRIRNVTPQLAEQCVIRDMRGVASPLPVCRSRKSALALYKHYKLLASPGMAGGELHVRQHQRLLLPPPQRRLAAQRETEQQRKLHHQRMKLGIKANILQKTILRETKYFL